MFRFINSYQYSPEDFESHDAVSVSDFFRWQGARTQATLEGSLRERNAVQREKAPRKLMRIYEIGHLVTCPLWGRQIA